MQNQQFSTSNSFSFSATTESQTDSQILPADSVSNTAAFQHTSKVSVIWNYFERVPTVDVEDGTAVNRVRCVLCTKKETLLKLNGSTTSNLWNHFKSNHKKEHKELVSHPEPTAVKQILVQKDLTSFFTNSSFSNEGLGKLIMEYIVMNDLSFRSIESPSFLRMMKFANPKAEIQSADTLKRSIMKEYNSVKNDVVWRYKNLNVQVSFTTDIWSTNTSLSFMAVTAHYIDSNWKIVDELIGFTPLLGKHTGLKLCEEFIKVLEH